MRIQENTVLSELGRLIETISDMGSVEEIYDHITKFIPTILPADHVTITRYRREDSCIVIQSSFDKEHVQLDLKPGKHLPSFETYQEYADNIANPIIYRPTDNLQREINQVLHQAGIVSVLIVPLISGLEIVGTINIGSTSHHYRQEDKFRLEKISALLAASITSTIAAKSDHLVLRHRLYAQHLEYLNNLSEKLLAAESVDDALSLVANCAAQLVSAARVSLCELDANPDYVRIVGLVGNSKDKRGTRILLTDSGLEDSLLHDKHKYTTDLMNSSVRAQLSLGESGYNHIWSFPIQCQGEAKRCLNVTSRATQLHPDDALSVLNTLARLANSTIERIAAQKETIRQAKTDPLTGLCNRKEFNERLSVAINKYYSNDSTCIMYLDLDLFKNVNDTMGHFIGDKVLLEVSKRVSKLLNEKDTLARIGGDEFMILLREIPESTTIEELADTLINTVGEPIKVGTQEISIGVSIGICQYPEHGTTIDELIKNADIAMYKAKEIGRNQYFVFTQTLSDELSGRVLLQKELTKAIRNDELSLVYQPQFSIDGLNAHCAEVLLRWEHPSLGKIAPDVFIPIAENCGLISSLTDWVLKKSLEDLAIWQKRYPELSLAVNISAVEFSPQMNLISRLSQAVEYAGVEPSALEIELTETAFLKHPTHAAELAKELSDIGFGIALDDFGTGYASLSYLVQLPIGCIKIDRSFVDRIVHDEKKQAVVKGILEIAKGLNIKSLGEGVETPEELGWLSDAGCDSVQGYLLSKPVNADELPTVIDKISQTNRAA
ncbi:MAG: EAL domain-containing protein [Gammaproteobacteria bacterium]|nr:EAL domain-containing protein [Gammaproteobacteria bacterium]